MIVIIDENQTTRPVMGPQNISVIKRWSSHNLSNHGAHTSYLMMVLIQLI